MIHEIILAGALLFHPQAAKDSIGIETVNGKTYVVHRVDEKETLYAISRRYGVSVESILQSNPGASTTLEIGQILKVPYEKKVANRPTAGNNTIHKVAAKETMYSISRMYGITVDELKKWNNLTDNNLSVGQELVVKKGSETAARRTTETTPVRTEAASTMPVPASGVHTVSTGETLFSLSKQYGIPVAQIRAWNSLDSDELKVGQVISLTANNSRRVSQTTTVSPQEPRNEPVETRTEAPRDQPAPSAQNKNQTIRISESMKNSDEVVESGLAELIEGTEGNRKYLAMHRTAPVGTILKVRNEMNNREVFVRVMGKLPDTAVNDKLIIKLSRSAYDRLGAIDPRFRVELTYYK